MSYFTRDAIEEIREAGRGHLIPDFDLWDIYGDDEDWHEFADALVEWEPTDWADVDSQDEQDAREEVEHGCD